MRCLLESEAGIGCEPLGAGGASDQERCGQRAAAGLGEQLRAVRPGQGEQLALERVRLAAQAADLRDLFARDPDASAGGYPAQPPADSVELACLSKRAGLDRPLELGAELEQVPAQPVLSAGALAHQVRSMVSEQADLDRPLIEIRGGKALHAILDDRARDGERVDLVRFARLALRRPQAPILCGATRTTRSPAASSACSSRRETCRQSSIAHTRPSSSPRAQRTAARCPGSSALIWRGAAPAAGSRVDGRKRVRALVRVRPDHDHLHRPFVWLSHRRSGSPADGSHSGRLPRSY